MDNNFNSTRLNEFYEGATVFITGATGFVGKALLEKLLRSCDGISVIYIMVRPKKGLTVDQRFKQLLKNPVFSCILDKKSGCFEKVKILHGDITQPNFGLNDRDKQTLVDEVNIAFHSAATVKFNENLKDAFALNTKATKTFMDICKDMKKLKSIVYVSTAYSNADKADVKEMVYPPLHDLRTLSELIEKNSPEQLDLVTHTFLGKHPNTYTLTKSVAEYIVSQGTGNGVPAAIVRPSIVTASWKEPFPGWIDNVSGPTGFIIEIDRGALRTMMCRGKCIVDIIPVDIVANTLIAAAWHNTVNGQNTLQVYNCTSGQINTLEWGRFGHLIESTGLQYPSKYVTWYPNLKLTTNWTWYYIYHLFLHMLPACIMDIILYSTKRKPIMLKLCNNTLKAVTASEFFTCNEWNFSNNNLKNLVDTLEAAGYEKEYVCDVRHINWESYIKTYTLGIRKHILKDDDSSFPAARSKLKKLRWLYWTLQIGVFCVLIHYLLNILPQPRSFM